MPKTRSKHSNVGCCICTWLKRVCIFGVESSLTTLRFSRASPEVGMSCCHRESERDGQDVRQQCPPASARYFSRTKISPLRIRSIANTSTDSSAFYIQDDCWSNTSVGLTWIQEDPAGTPIYFCYLLLNQDGRIFVIYSQINPGILTL